MSQRTSSRPSGMELLDRLRRLHKLPLTVQRRAVLEALVARHDHPTADDVLADVQARLPGISRPTVYRILDTLVRIGVARKVCHPGAAARFETRTERHHHLVCVHCDKVIDFDHPSLHRIPLPDARGQGFQLEDYSIHFRGTCADCARTLRPRQDGRRANAGSKKRARPPERRSP